MKEDNSLIKKLKNFCKYNNVEFDDLLIEIRHEQKEQENKEMREAAARNKQLVGKCFRRRVKPRSGMFPEMYRYYKVVSEQAVNSCCVSCLTFDEEPYYWFEYQAHKAGFPGDFFLGEFDFTPICVKSKLLTTFRLTGVEEISEDEFNTALSCLGQKIAEMPWSAEHYRYGGKLPTDEGWIKKEN